MITVTSKVTLYRINDKEAPVGTEELQISNVWNANNLVEISFGAVSIAVHRNELLKAIENATNNEVK